MSYDDHLGMLRQFQCFIMRKIWLVASYLYDSFLQLQNPDAPTNSAEAVLQALTCLVAGASALALQGRLGF